MQFAGKLVVLRSKGGTPQFALQGKDMTIIKIPLTTEWLFKRLGNNVSLLISDEHWQLTNIDIDIKGVA